MPRVKKQSYNMRLKRKRKIVRKFRAKAKLEQEQEQGQAIAEVDKQEKRREQQRFRQPLHRERKRLNLGSHDETRAKIEEIKTQIRAQMAKEKRIAAEKSVKEMRIQEQKKIEEQKRIEKQKRVEQKKTIKEQKMIEAQKKIDELKRIEAKNAQSIDNLKCHNIVKFKSAQIAAGENFDRIVPQIQMLNCANCARTYPSSPNQLLLKSNNSKCPECPGDPTKFTAANKMNPGPVPVELSNLTYIEQMLIAQIHPVVSFYKINKKIGYTYRGNVINFRQDISRDYTTVLPVRPSELACTVLFCRDTIPAGLENFRVRADRIRKALYWLKENNIYYSDIEISEYNLALLPEES